MCSECDWSEEKGVGHQIRQKCDCGNLKWQWTALMADDAIQNSPLKSIYRCTKCDSLRLAKHLLHPHLNR